MKTTIRNCSGAIPASILLSLLSTTSAQPFLINKQGKTMEIHGIEIRALASAYRFAESARMDIENYKVYLNEDDLTFLVSFVDIGKPPGFRRSREGFPQPTLRIDKKTGEILEKTFSR